MIFMWEHAFFCSRNNAHSFKCVDLRGRTVATWSQEQLQLIVVPRVEGIMDRVVVTCMLNLWIKQVGQW